MAQFFDRPERLLRLAARAEPRFRRRFLEVVGLIRNERTIEQLIVLLQSGNLQQALVSAEIAALRLGSMWGDVYVGSASETAGFVGSSLQTLVDFNRVNSRALSALELNQLRLVQGFTQQQVLATRTALAQGTALGLNPVQQARAFRDSIGLTPHQVEIVNNYRRKLENGDLSPLQNQLRDRRFDSSVRRAASGGRPLTQTQIDTMVGRYRDRWIKFRAETIARTEALDAVHQGNQEMYRQAIENGTLRADEVYREWSDSDDNRVRDTHMSMDGQRRGLTEPFLSPSGAQLMRPLDPNAPAEERIKCRCGILTRFTDTAKKENLEAQQSLAG